jgi:hypothetical protein
MISTSFNKVNLAGRMERPAFAHPVPLPLGIACDYHALRQQVRRQGVPAQRPRQGHKPPPDGSGN